MFRSGAFAAGVLALAAFVALPAATGLAAPPPPCNNAPQITDAATDGHHPPTDVLAAWWTEGSGHLQAVIRVYAGTPAAEHDEAEVPGAGYAVIFNAAGQTRYVRATLPDQRHAVVRVRHLHARRHLRERGRHDRRRRERRERDGHDRRPGASAGGHALTRPFVITYDGINAGVPTGSTTRPAAISRPTPPVGADYVVGSLRRARRPPGGAVTTTAVQLGRAQARDRPQDRDVTGKVLPARAGVPGDDHAHGQQEGARCTRVTSAADGTFSARIAIDETTRPAGRAPRTSARPS